MRTALALLIAFTLPFGFLGLASLPQYFDRMESQSLVEAWLESQANGGSGEEFWKSGSKQTVDLTSLVSWELIEVSRKYVDIEVLRLDRQGRPNGPEEFRVCLGSEYGGGGSDVPKIVFVKNKSDSMGTIARMAQDHVEDWLQVQREGGSGVGYWANGTDPSRFLSVSGWDIVKPPENEINTSLNVLVNSANKLGYPLRKLWRIEVQHEPSAYTDDYDPRISKIVDLSD